LCFRYSEVSGWGFVAVGVFLANAWVLVSKREVIKVLKLKK
jgi:hypothetical protein